MRGAGGLPARSTDDGATWTQSLSGREALNTHLTDKLALTVDASGHVELVTDPTMLWQSVNGTNWQHLAASQL